MELGGVLWTSVLNLALLPQWHRRDAWLEHQASVHHTAQNKRKKRKKERRIYNTIQYNTIKLFK